MGIFIGKNATEPYSAVSTGNNSNPITRSVTLDGSGGTVTTEVVTKYLVAQTYNYTGIEVEIMNNPTGVTWQVSLQESEGFGSLITPSAMDALAGDQVTPIYARAEVANDGSVGTSIITDAVFRVTATENPA